MFQILNTQTCRKNGLGDWKLNLLSENSYALSNLTLIILKCNRLLRLLQAMW